MSVVFTHDSAGRYIPFIDTTPWPCYLYVVGEYSGLSQFYARMTQQAVSQGIPFPGSLRQVVSMQGRNFTSHVIRKPALQPGHSAVIR